MLDVSEQLKNRGARRIFIFSTFGLFNSGLEKFDKAYNEGIFDRVFTTNLVYTPTELLAREWYTSVDVTKFMAYIIDTLNYDRSISGLLNQSDKINTLLGRNISK